MAACLYKSSKTLGVQSDRSNMSDVVSLPSAGWDTLFSTAEQDRAIRALEQGNVLLFPQLHLSILHGEDRLLSPASAGQGKNVSLDPSTSSVRGCRLDARDLALLNRMMVRFAASSSGLLRNLFPSYRAGLQQARTSFRPIEIAGRSTSWRKDDRRLHVDSFPSSPTGGKRILRVFSNVGEAAPGGSESRSNRLQAATWLH